MRWVFCQDCHIDGCCENQDRGNKCEVYAKKITEENQQLKELLSQIRNRQSLIREYLSGCKLGSAWDLLYQTENEIDNAIGEK